MTRLIRGLWNFVSTLKNATGNILFLALIAIVIFSLASTESRSVPDETALILNPTGTIVDQRAAVDPFNEFLGGYQQDSDTLLRDLLEAIETGEKDPRVKSLVIQTSKLSAASMSKLEELGEAIERFKRSGKPVYAFAPNYSQGQYLIAVRADKVYLDGQGFQTFGGVFLTGLGVYPTYFKSALDNLKINFHIFKAGLYKGAVEPYLRDNMSAAAKEANAGWIGVLWNQYRDIIVKARGISPESFDAYTNRYDELLAEVNNDSAELAVREGLVDAIITKQAWLEEMQSIAGTSGETYNHITYRSYLLATRNPIPVVNPGAEKIAVITASGTIYDGERPAGDIGSDSISVLIRAARTDDRVKALVVRIDSPGGSASASEQIRSELALTQAEGKPVIVSMSGYAASGGYWIATTANKIFAANSTVTGSIGTFILFPTFEDSLNELGVHSDGVGTTSLSGAFNAFGKINPVLQRTLEQSVKHTYGKFLGLVAEGREMSVAEVDEIAQGRVWAGTTAVELGLVDAIGSLADAITSAALLADLDQYEVIYLEKELSTRERLLEQLLSNTLSIVYKATGEASGSWRMLGKMPRELDSLIHMSRAPGIYSQCIYCRIN